MTFSSMSFLWVFLPVVLLVYWLTPYERLRQLWLLISSVVFFLWNDAVGMMVVSLVILVNWGLGKIINHRKILLLLGVTLDLLFLCAFKYYEIISGLSLRVFGIEYPAFFSHMPMGMSFIAFLAISYLVDTYKEGDNGNGLLPVINYFLFFPKVSSGPLVKYSRFNYRQSPNRIDLRASAYGIKRFIIGLAKKVIIADQLATAVTGLFLLDFSTAPSRYLWVAVLLYTVQIYFDFSGYSDMAIGLAALFGYELPENFDHPYSKKSMTVFWRSWHMTLTSWFRDYLYIPLGGNRKGYLRTLINIAIVFVCTGIWHGSGLCFIAWGLWHGLFMIAERVFLKDKLDKINPLISHVYVLLVTVIGWVFFRAGSLTRALQMLKGMISFRSTGALPLQMFVSPGTWAIFAIGIIFAFPVPEKIAGLFTKVNDKSKAVLETAVLAVILLLSITFIVSGSYLSFIYFQF